MAPESWRPRSQQSTRNCLRTLQSSGNQRWQYSTSSGTRSMPPSRKSSGAVWRTATAGWRRSGASAEMKWATPCEMCLRALTTLTRCCRTTCANPRRWTASLRRRLPPSSAAWRSSRTRRGRCTTWWPTPRRSRRGRSTGSSGTPRLGCRAPARPGARGAGSGSRRSSPPGACRACSSRSSSSGPRSRRTATTRGTACSASPPRPVSSWYASFTLATPSSWSATPSRTKPHVQRSTSGSSRTRSALTTHCMLASSSSRSCGKFTTVQRKRRTWRRRRTGSRCKRMPSWRTST
mmetsp:Transcript_47304/g.133423  ORF Transcript_47304/g.133423 Transcript_47304/m.133423 type:complete len:292 (-) Transcript_47304:303-1178(-)